MKLIYFLKTIDLFENVDWFSIKITGVSITLALITWNQFLGILSGVALISTIVYNVIKIIKEVKRKQ
jgi:large-conductance mechanosensitive channel